MPLLWLSLAFLAGLILGDWVHWAWQMWLAVGGVCLAAWLLAQVRWLQRGVLRTWIFHPGRKIPIAPALLAAAVLLGAARYQAVHPALTTHDLAWYNGRGDYQLAGWVVEPPDERDSSTFLRFEVEQIAPYDKDKNQAGTAVAVSGTAQVKVLSGQWRYGDRLVLTGSPEDPPDTADFSFKEYLARQGVYTYLAYPSAIQWLGGGGSPLLGWIFGFREGCRRVLMRILPSPEADLLSGILLGLDASLPADVQQAFKVTGTAHIIAISGFNISILAGLFFLVFARLLGRWWGSLAAVIGVILYSLMVGGSASVVRAAIMGSLGIFGRQIGRSQAGANSLAFSAAVMGLVDPNLPWDIGFQLSFMATLGLVLYADPLQQGFARLVNRWLPLPLARRVVDLGGEYFLFTIAAQITTLPVMLYHFRSLSLVALLANPLVLPPQPLVMVLGGAAVLGGWIDPLIGQALGYLAWPFVTYTIRMVRWLAGLPLASIPTGAIGLGMVVVLYALILAVPLVKNWRDWIRREAVLRAGLVLLAVLTLAVWRERADAPDGSLRLSFLAAGDGCGGLLVQTPQGRSVLVNGGKSASQLAQVLGQRLPLFHRELDFLLVLPAQSGGLEGLPGVLDRYPISRALWAGDPDQAANRSAGLLAESLVDRRIPMAAMAAGQRFDLGGAGSGASLVVLGVQKNSAVLMLEWEAFRAVLPVGAFEMSFLQEATRPLGWSTVLLLAGRGEAKNNPPAWVQSLSPRLLVACTPSSSPAPEDENLRRLAPILSPRQDGEIEIRTDGRQMWVSTQGVQE